MPSEAFLRTLTHDHEKASHQRTLRKDPPRPTGKLSRKSVDDWRTQFDIDEKDIAEFTKLENDSRSPVTNAKKPARKFQPPSPGTSPAHAEPPLPDHIIEEAMRMLEEDVS